MLVESFNSWFVLVALGLVLFLILVLLVQRLYQNPLLQKNDPDNKESRSEREMINDKDTLSPENIDEDVSEEHK